MKGKQSKQLPKKKVQFSSFYGTMKGKQNVSINKQMMSNLRRSGQR